MTDQLRDLRGRLGESMGFALTPPSEGEAAKSEVELSLLAVGDALHAVSLAGLALLGQRNNHVAPLAEAAVQAVTDPSLESHARFQTLLFPAYREIFGQVFPSRYASKDVLPLYLRKYVQVLGELAALSRLPVEGRRGDQEPQVLVEAMTFLVNNWTNSVAVLRPTSKVPEGPLVEHIEGSLPASGKVKALSNQIRPGLYLLSENHQPVALHPFFTCEEDQCYAFRMITSDGLFYRALGREGFSLLFTSPLLMDMGDYLFRLGAFDRAIQLYRLMESENREAFIMVSALNHCLNARALASKGDPVRAGAEWELALAVRPDCPALYHAAAEDYMAAGRHGQAAALLNRLLERFPVSDQGYLALGGVYMAKGDVGRAQRAFEKATVLNPHNQEALEKRRQAQERLESRTGGDAEKSGDVAAEDVLLNVTDRVAARQRTPLIGRGAAVNQLVEILACKDKHNALVIGEAGVGKTALVEELALRLMERDAPDSLKGRTVMALNLPALISGARYRGQFEERVLEVIRRVRERRPVLLVENLHQLVATGTSRGGSLDSASLMKPALMRGDMQVVGTTDEESFANVLSKDPSFLKLFHLVRLEELSVEQVQEVVKSRAPIYGAFHGVRFPEGLLEGMVEMVRMSITRSALPESILDVADRTAARVSLRAARGGLADPEVRRDDVLETLSEMSGVSYERLSLLDREHLASMEDLLSNQVVGQGEAVRTVARVIRTAKLGMDLNVHRPDGVFLFVGPTGVGKTELARSIAKLLFGDEEKLIRIDMSEYMERISSSRLIGTAPGYVGYYDQNQLTDQVRKNPYCVVLFDEVEKADPLVLNLFLQIFDAGRLTDGKGNTVRFHNATIVMTSNVGTHLYSKNRVGYGEGESPVTEEEVLRAVRQQFSPEFLNRVDEVVVFKSLGAGALGRIVDLQLADLVDRLAHQGKTFVLEPQAREALAEEGYSFEYGARNLGRTLRRRIAEPLAELALQPRWESSRIVRAVLRKGLVELELEAGDARIELPGSEGEREGERGEP